MKIPLFNPKWYLTIMSLFFLLTFALQPHTLNAQKISKDESKCTENIVGFVDGYVIFNCNKKVKGAKDCKGCEVTPDDCGCAAKKFKGAKGCIDGCGNVYKITAKADAIDDPVAENETGDPSFHFLAGETNCRLQSEFGTFVMSARSGEKEVKDLTLSAEGDTDHARWDFKAVEDGNHFKGFYILTREDNPRALMADGTNLSLRKLETMDGKMHEKAHWNFFINGKDEDGNTNYNLRPQQNPDKLVLAADGENNKLILIGKKSKNPDTLVAKGNEKSVIRPEKKAKNWNCECIF